MKRVRSQGPPLVARYSNTYLNKLHKNFSLGTLWAHWYNKTMQKILGFSFHFVVVQHYFCKSNRARSGVKIKFRGYEYVQFDRLKHMRSKRGEFKDLTESQFGEFINKNNQFLE